MIITCRKQIPLRWIGFTVLPWASFSLNFTIIGAAFIFSIKKFVENPAAVAFILSLPGFLAIIVAPVSSFLSDRIWTRFGRRKPFVVWGGVGMVTGLVTMPLAPNFWVLVGAYVLYHVCDGASAPREPLKQEIVPPPERGRATGAMTWWQNLATVVFYSVMLGRFDDVRYFAGFPLHGEAVIYWSAALLLTVMVLLVALGIKEIDQKSPLVGQRLSPRNIVASLFDRELWPVYLLVLSHGLLNFFASFGPFLTTLLYTDQWNYTKQEMGNNVAIGGIINIFIIGLLTVFADRLPRMRALRIFFSLSLLWNVLYYCYVNFMLPDQRPSLVEIIIFGEVVSILSILSGLVYTPLIYDYVRRNKMGTFAAGMQITTRGTHLFTLNGIGLFVWAYAMVFQPPAGEMTRVVLREETTESAFNDALRSETWQHSQTGASVSAEVVSAQVWQADGVAADRGRTWEIRFRNEESAALAKEKKHLTETRSPLLAEEKRLLTDSLIARNRNQPTDAHRLASEAALKHAESTGLSERITAIDQELAARAENFQAQIAKKLGSRLIADGEQVLAAQRRSALVLELGATRRPDAKMLEKSLVDLRAEFPALIDLRPLKLNDTYGVTVSALLEPQESPLVVVERLRDVVEKIIAKRDPALAAAGFQILQRHTTTALGLDLQIVEEPVSLYVSPITRAFNTVLGVFDRAPTETRKLDAIARKLRSVEQTPHVRVTPGPGRSISVVALFDPSAEQSPIVDDAVANRITTLLQSPDNDLSPAQLRAFYDRVETAAAGQRVTVARQFISSDYAPMKYDYMAGYIWVLFVGLIGLALTFVFGRLESRGVISKRGVEEANAS